MENLVASPFKLNETIGYQDGSVVSRELLHKKKGTITLFAFDKGQGLSEHTAPFDATILCLDGELKATIDGTPIKVQEGEMLIMPADKPHSIIAIKKFKMLLIMIRT